MLRAILVTACIVLGIGLTPVIGFGLWAGTQWAITAMGGDAGTARELAVLSLILAGSVLAAIFLGALNS